LKKNGIDISGHTVKDSYKQVEESFGYSFDMFCQLIYQSSDFSMNFLEATPAVRRKFLTGFIDAEAIQEDIDKASNKAKELKQSQANYQQNIRIQMDTKAKAAAELENIKRELVALSVPLTTEDECRRRIEDNKRSIDFITQEENKLDELTRKVESVKQKLSRLRSPQVLSESIPDKVALPAIPDKQMLTSANLEVDNIRKNLASVQTKISTLDKEMFVIVNYLTRQLLRF